MLDWVDEHPTRGSFTHRYFILIDNCFVESFSEHTYGKTAVMVFS